MLERRLIEVKVRRGRSAMFLGQYVGTDSRSEP